VCRSIYFQLPVHFLHHGVHTRIKWCDHRYSPHTTSLLSAISLPRYKIIETEIEYYVSVVTLPASAVPQDSTPRNKAAAICPMVLLPSWLRSQVVLPTSLTAHEHWLGIGASVSSSLRTHPPPQPIGPTHAAILHWRWSSYSLVER